jgi:hypothetical protein
MLYDLRQVLVHHRLTTIQAYIANTKNSGVAQEIADHGPRQLLPGHEFICAVETALASQIAGGRQGYKDAPWVRLRHNRKSGGDSVLSEIECSVYSL